MTKKHTAHAQDNRNDPAAVKADVAKLREFHQQFNAAMDAGDTDQAAAVLTQATPIVTRDPAAAKQELQEA